MTSRIANLSNLIFSLSLATGLLCAGATASAQTTASVTIPFAFSADNQNVEAGSYKVELLSDRYLSLRNIATNQTQVLMVRPEAGQAIETLAAWSSSRKDRENTWLRSGSPERACTAKWLFNTRGSRSRQRATLRPLSWP